MSYEPIQMQRVPFEVLEGSYSELYESAQSFITRMFPGAWLFVERTGRPVLSVLHHWSTS